MENNNENGKFEYTYSAKEQAELKRIREKYLPKEVVPENKMERLLRLDAKVARKAQTVALTIGILGTLILGFGMSLVMTELSEILGSYEDLSMPIGIVVGVLGGLLAALAYPTYNSVTKHEREKIAPEIIRLTDELMK